MIIRTYPVFLALVFFCFLVENQASLRSPPRLVWTQKFWMLRLGLDPPPPATVVGTFWHKMFKITKLIPDRILINQKFEFFY